MKFSQKKQDEFAVRFREAMITWRKFTDEVYLLLDACNRNQDFKVLNGHYHAAEDAAKQLGEDHRFLISLLPPPPEDPSETEPMEVQRSRAIASFIDKRSIIMFQAMNAYRPWLRTEHLRRGLEAEEQETRS